MCLSSRLLKNTFAPRIALQSHAQEEVSIAFSLERQDLIFEFSFHVGERERKLSLFLAFIGVSGHIHNLKTTLKYHDMKGLYNSNKIQT